MDPTPAAIRCDGLTKRYGDVTALDALDMRVPSGAIFGFLGPNGAGKTTAIRLLTGLAQPSGGSAAVAGQPVILGSPNLHARIGYVPQAPNFYGWMTGRELVAFAAELAGLRAPTLRGRVDEALGIVGLTDAARRRVAGYSGGMKQRLSLAQALVHRPEVLFLDEPVAALDPAGRHEILGVIAGLRGAATVFMSSHILADIERVCDRVAIIAGGKLVVEAGVAELQERYAQPVYVLEPELGQDRRVAALVEALRAAPWVARVAEEGGELRVVVADPAAAGRAILPLIACSDITLARFERSRPSLEEIFLRLTDPTARAAVPS